MHLQKVNGVSFYREIREIEGPLTPGYESWLGLSWFFFLMVGPIVATLLAGSVGASKLWMVITYLLTFTTSGYVGIWFWGRKRYLPASARQFCLENKAEEDDLGKRVENFNDTLYIHQRTLLSANPTGENSDGNPGDYWEERRQLLQEKLDNFVARYRAAVSVDLERYYNNPKQLRRAFKKNVKRLKELERSLDALDDGYNNTQDISPYVAAAKLREQLEEERIRLGLSQKILPKAQSLLPKA